VEDEDAVFAQDAAPKFEVASVKLTAAGVRGRRIRVTAGGLTTENATVRQLIQNAYGVQDFQISGGPGWIQTDGYSIDAKAASEVPQAQIYRMLQSLLAERFQLQVRRETRELPVYNLTVAKSGSKLQPSKDGSCAILDPLAPLPPRTLPCGRALESLEAQGAQMVAGIHGGRVPMTEFIRALSRSLGRPVVDKTGFTDAFDLQLVFTPDEATAGIPHGSPGDAPNPSGAPSIFAAIQEQLGLKLEAAKGPVETIVIDRVERPTGN
jgi:uncharacterized protein (TIGR03435 family)